MWGGKTLIHQSGGCQQLKYFQKEGISVDKSFTHKWSLILSLLTIYTAPSIFLQTLTNSFSSHGHMKEYYPEFLSPVDSVSEPRQRALRPKQEQRWVNLARGHSDKGAKQRGVSQSTIISVPHIIFARGTQQLNSKEIYIFYSNNWKQNIQILIWALSCTNWGDLGCLFNLYASVFSTVKWR